MINTARGACLRVTRSPSSNRARAMFPPVSVQSIAAIAAAGTATVTGVGSTGAPAASPAPGDAGTTASSTTATLVVSGNDPAQWQQGQPWRDNLGALFTHDGQSETIY